MEKNIEEAANIELFKDKWYSRNPTHECDDNGKDRFWETSELVAREYVSALSQPSPHLEGVEDWVSVKEDKPPIYEPKISILVNVTDGKSVTAGYYDFEEKNWKGYGFHNEKGEITHWRYFPSLPLKNQLPKT